jgi:hypothetical protein
LEMRVKRLGFKRLEWIKLPQAVCTATNMAIIFRFYVRRESGQRLKKDLRV